MNRKVHNFIQFSEINENFITEEDNELPAPTEETPAEDGAPAEGDVPPAEPTEDDEPTPSGEGIPEILKVYTDSEEDLQELRDAGIDVDGDGEGEDDMGAEDGSASDGEDGLENGEEIGEDVLFIKVKTTEGDDVILKFTEEDPENRIPVEGEENTFDTELVAQHNDFEYRITAEIKVNPTTGEEEELDVEPEAQIEEQPAEGEEGAEPTEPSEAPAEDDENSVVPESRIMNFTQFLNEAKKAPKKEEKKDDKKKKDDKTKPNFKKFGEKKDDKKKKK